MIYLRAGSGLGDSIYLLPIAKYLQDDGMEITVLSNYPEIFAPAGLRVEPFRRHRVNIVAHYTAGKTNPHTTQFEDMCAAAGLPPIDFDIFWQDYSESILVKEIIAQAGARRIVLVHGGREPFNRTDGFGIDLMPQQAAFAQVCGALADCFLVGIGRDKPHYSIPVERDLNGKTSIVDLFNLALISSGIVAQCSFAVPLAEALAVPLLAIWSQRGLDSRTPYVRSITPSKILCKPTSRYVIDSWSRETIMEVIHGFRQF